MNQIIEMQDMEYSQNNYNQNVERMYKSKKKSPFINIVIITFIITLILIAILAYVFFCTNLLKSDKEMFLIYGSQLFQSENGFMEESIMDFNEKISTVPFEYNYKVSIDSGNLSDNYEEGLDIVDDVYITLNGKIDMINNNYIGDITVNYTEDINTTINYMLIDTFIGMQSDMVGVNYITLDNSEEFSEDSAGIIGFFNEIYNQVISKENLNEEVFTEEYIEYFKDTYFNIINNVLSEDKFIIIEEENKTGYKLTINEQDFINVIVELLTILKDDDVTLEKINSFSEDLLTKEDISNYIEELDIEDEIDYEETLDIILFQTNGKLDEIKVLFDEEEILKISKTIIDNNIEYIVQILSSKTDETMIYELIASYTILEDSSQMNSNYNINFYTITEEEEVYGGIIIDNTIILDETLEIDQVDNVYLINELSTYELESLLQKIFERIIVTTEEQFKDIGYFDEDYIGVYEQSETNQNITNKADLTEKINIWVSSNIVKMYDPDFNGEYESIDVLLSELEDDVLITLEDYDEETRTLTAYNTKFIFDENFIDVEIIEIE